jgi:peroxiredoxin
MLIPHNIEMVDSYKDKPFALVGINSDGDRSVLQKIIKEQKINYRNAVDGSTSGPIATKWNVHGWPTVYVIDGLGMIRNKFIGVDPKVLTEAVEKLLKE